MMMLAQRIAVNECDVYQRRVVCVQTAEHCRFICMLQKSSTLVQRWSIGGQTSKEDRGDGFTCLLSVSLRILRDTCGV